MGWWGRRAAPVVFVLVCATATVTGCTSTGGVAVRAVTGAPTGSTATRSSTMPVPTLVSTPQHSTSQSTFPPAVPGRTDGLLWTQNAAKPLGQPVAVGGTVVVYALHGSALSIEALDAANGKIRWQQPAATGAAAAGIELVPAVSNGRVVYLRPVQGSMVNTSVVVADVLTGRDTAVSQQNYPVGSRPVGCQDRVCFSVFSGTDQQAVVMDPATGAVSSAGAGTGGRTIGPYGLESVQQPGKPEQLTRSVDRSALWTTPIASIFRPGFSTNGGWVFHVLPKQNLLIGSVGAYDPDHPQPTDLELGTSLEMAGIDLSTGARRWLLSGGVDYQCMPQAAVVEGGPLVDVRCRWGTDTVAHRVGNQLVLRTASWSVEGFDPATGATTWTVPLADPSGKSPQAALQRIEVVGENTLLVPGRTSEQLIDPVSGTIRPAPADTAAVCVVGIETSLAGGERTINGRTSNQYATGSRATRCTADGAPTTRASTSWPSWVGATAGQVHVVTTSDGLQGFKR